MKGILSLFAIGLLAPATLAGEMTPAEFVADVSSRGGRTTADDKKPGKPVVNIDLHRVAINGANAWEVYSFHTGGANCLFGDGSVRFLKESLSIQTFAAMVTRAGGEVLGND